MDRLDRQHLSDWLGAEAEGRADQADRALGVIMRRVPRRAPAPGFADRVMRATRVVRAVPVFDPFRSWWVRSILGGALASCGLALTFVAPGQLIAVSVGAAGWAVTTLARAGVWAAAWTSSALAFWEWAAGIAHALALALTSPPAAMLLLANAAVAAGSFVMLHRFLALERS
jgi:hypothetical protein